VQGLVSTRFQTVLVPDIGLILFLDKHSHPYIIPLVENSIVCLPHPCGILLQVEFGLHEADRGFTLCTTQVQQIVTLII
jgi:hypothetical protein